MTEEINSIIYSLDHNGSELLLEALINLDAKFLGEDLLHHFLRFGTNIIYLWMVHFYIYFQIKIQLNHG